MQRGKTEETFLLPSGLLLPFTLASLLILRAVEEASTDVASLIFQQASIPGQHWGWGSWRTNQALEKVVGSRDQFQPGTRAHDTWGLGRPGQVQANTDMRGGMCTHHSKRLLRTVTGSVLLSEGHRLLLICHNVLISAFRRKSNACFKNIAQI